MKGVGLKIYAYLKKDFLLLAKRKKYLYLFILLPLIIGMLFLFALNPKEYDIKVGVCDFDGTDVSREAFSDLAGFSAVVINNASCAQVLQEKVKRGEFDLGVEIPRGFAANLEELKQSRLIVYYDNTDVAFANLISWKVDNSLAPFERGIIDKLNSEVSSKIGSVRDGVDLVFEFGNFNSKVRDKIEDVDKDLKALEEMDTEFLTNPIWTDQRGVYAEDLKKDVGIVYIFPILAIFIILMLASTSIIYDKNTGFIERVKVSSNPVYYVFSKILFFTALVFVQFLIILLLFMFYGGKYSLEPIHVLQLILLVGIVNTALGLIIGLLSDNEGIAVLFSLMVSFPLMLISGIFFPVQALPKSIQFLGSVMPLHYEIVASKSVLLFGEGVGWGFLWFGLGLFCLVWYLVRRK